ncbi:hypothetical protein HAX54_014013 [Datura stramonium]|uniref:Uncharacterized protein n=1 Tax=Datura stramonium TaxID=4076 RepID=A0ABS8TMF8_DATST|nr:hypothetical protein [Datura stramonium]
MFAQEDGPSIFDSIFALMAKSDGEYDEKASILDIQKNLKHYSQKELRALDNVLIDAYHGIINEKGVLATDLQQSKRLKKCMESEFKGKKFVTKLQVKLEDELEKIKLNLSSQLERNEDLEKELINVNTGLDKSLRWNWFFQALVSANKRNGHNGGVDAQTASQEPGTSSSFSKKEHQLDSSVNISESLGTEGFRDEGTFKVPDPSSQQRLDFSEIQVSNWKNKGSYPLENVITPLNTGILTHSMAQNILKTKAMNECEFLKGHCSKEPSEGQVPQIGDDPAPIVNLNELSIFTNQDDAFVEKPKEVDSVIGSTGATLSTKPSIPPKEGMSNILENKEETIEHFMTAMATRASGGGEQTPVFVKKDSTDQLSFPKWDGTSMSLVSVVVVSPTLEDDEVPPQLGVQH